MAKSLRRVWGPRRRLPPLGGSHIEKSLVLYHVLVALVAILLLGRWLGKLFVHFGQPRVIGEMVAGIMLGPSLLGPHLARRDGLHPADDGPNDIRGTWASSPRSA